MRIDKKRLREILVEYCVENAIPNLRMVKQRPSALEIMRDLLRRGIRERDTLDKWWAVEVVSCVERTFRNMGYWVEIEPEEECVCVKMFTSARVKTWVCMTRDIAEKILVFGEVPNLNAFP